MCVLCTTTENKNIKFEEKKTNKLGVLIRHICDYPSVGSSHIARRPANNPHVLCISYSRRKLYGCVCCVCCSVAFSGEVAIRVCVFVCFVNIYSEYVPKDDIDATHIKRTLDQSIKPEDDYKQFVSSHYIVFTCARPMHLSRVRIFSWCCGCGVRSLIIGLQFIGLVFVLCLCVEKSCNRYH